MADVGRYRTEDRRQVEALYRRVFGPDSAEANRLRWEWQYRLNPNARPDGPLIWIAREGQTVIGQYAAMPVTLSVMDREVDAAWGMDVMVAPERQRQGLGEVLFRTWDREVGASLGLGLVRLVLPALPEDEVARPGSRALPGEAAQPARAPPPELAGRLESLRVGHHAAVDPPGGALAAAPGRSADDSSLRRELHAPLGARPAAASILPCAATRAYLNWKYGHAPHVRYSVAALMRDGEAAGFVVYRHVQEPRGRVTLLVDFLADPEDKAGVLDAPALGRSRGPRGRLGQDPHLCHARGLPQDPAGNPATTR